MECHEIQPLLAAHALGALDGEERARVEEHLSTCLTCQAVLEPEHRVVRQLPFVANLVEPPASLKARVLAQINALEAAEKAPQAGVATGERDTRRWPWAGPLRPVYGLALSLAVLAFLLLGWSIHQTLRVNDLGREADQLTSTVVNQWGALTFATSPNVETVSLAGTRSSPTTWGNLLLDPENEQAMILVVGLTPPSSRQVYQLWYWGWGDSFIDLGTFRTWGEGYGMWLFRPAFSLGDQGSFVVTMEPQGGSPAPMGRMLLGGDIQAGD